MVIDFENLRQSDHTISSIVVLVELSIIGYVVFVFICYGWLSFDCDFIIK